MALTTEIMTTTEVRTEALVGAKFDLKYLKGHVLPSQRKFIREFIGNDFYEELLTQIDASTETADNLELIDDYIKPSLANYVVYRSLPRIRNQIAKGGVFLNLSDTSDAVDNQGYGQIREDYLSKAEELREEIDFFIRDARDDDSSKYPLYCKKASQSQGIIFYKDRQKRTFNFNDEDFKT